MRPIRPIDFPWLIPAVAFAASVAFAQSPIPCDLIETCAPTPSPTVDPFPGNGDYPSGDAFWFWFSTTLGAALATFAIGLLGPLRAYLRRRIEKALEREGRIPKDTDDDA